MILFSRQDKRGLPLAWLARAARWGVLTIVLVVAGGAKASALQLDGGLAIALELALTHHPSVLGKALEVEGGEYFLRSQRARRYPSLALGAATLENEFDQVQTSVRVQQPLYTFGKINAGIESAAAALSAERHELLRVRRELVSDVAVAYLSVLGERELQAIALRNAARHRELLEHIQRREAGDLASSGDAGVALVRSIQADGLLKRSRADLESALNALVALTVKPVTAIEPPSRSLFSLPELEVIIEKGRAEDARILFQRAKVKEANAQARAEALSLAPDLALRAERNFSDDPLRQVQGDFRVGLVLSSSVEGLGLAAWGRKQAAAVQARAVKQELALIELEVERDLRSAHQEVEVLASLLADQASAIEYMSATAQSFFRLYETGRKSWVELLNIEREFAEQSMRGARMAADYEKQVVRLKSRIGMLDGLMNVDS